MAPKRLIEDPPSAFSSSETEAESDFKTMEDDREIDSLKGNSADENGTREDTDDELENHSSRNNSPNPSPKISKQENSMDGDSGFVSDTDSEKTQSSPSASAFTIKPIIRKHIGVSSKVKNIVQNPSSNSVLVTPASSGLKRPAERNLCGAEPKKKKISNGDDEGKVSGSGINRLWSENDEISVLQGMIDFQTMKGSDLYADMNLLHEFIRKNLSVDVSKNQLINKVRRLKKKYKNNVEKCENGEEPPFSKPHQHKSFELSKKIWGNEAKKKPRKQSVKVSNSASINLPRQDVEAATKVAVNLESKIFPDEFLSDYPWLKASFHLENDKLWWSERVMSLVRERMPLIGSDKARELDDKWRKLGQSELELYLKKVELVTEQYKLILDSVGKATS